MRVATLIEKYGPDGYLEKSWALPDDVVDSLREFVLVAPEGWIVDCWPITAEIAEVVQPWVDEPIDVTSGAWMLSSERQAS